MQKVQPPALIPFLEAIVEIAARQLERALSDQERAYNTYGKALAGSDSLERAESRLLYAMSWTKSCRKFMRMCRGAYTDAIQAAAKAQGDYPGLEQAPLV